MATPRTGPELWAMLTGQARKGAAKSTTTTSKTSTTTGKTGTTAGGQKINYVAYADTPAGKAAAAKAAATAAIRAGHTPAGTTTLPGTPGHRPTPPSLTPDQVSDNRYGPGPSIAGGEMGGNFAQSIRNQVAAPGPAERIDPTRRATVEIGHDQVEAQRKQAQEQSDLATGVASEVTRGDTERDVAYAGLDKDQDTRMATFDKQATLATNRANAAGGEVRFETQRAIGDIQAQVTSGQGQINTERTAALTDVLRGQNASNQAAVQGLQAQIKNQESAINADPNLTAGQKSQQIRAMRMNGSAALIPAIGANAQGWAKLRAETAVSFGNMSANIQTAGVNAVGAAATTGLTAYANTKVAAAQVGANILATRASANDNYMDAQQTLQQNHALLELQGDALRAQLIPVQGTAVADHFGVGAWDTETLSGLIKIDVGATAGLIGMQAGLEGEQQRSYMATLGLLGSIPGVGPYLVGAGALAGPPKGPADLQGPNQY